MQKSLGNIIPALLLSIAITSCGESDDSAYDRGYSDGYAAGYNTTCKIRSTMIAGDWDNKAYSQGYNAGYSTGSADCKRK